MKNSIKRLIIALIIVAILIILIFITKLTFFSDKKIESVDEDYNSRDSEIVSTNSIDVSDDTSSTSNYSVNEYYTDQNYYYIYVVMDSNYTSSGQAYNYAPKEITYVRYIYKDDNWILAESDSPLFKQTGKGVILDSKRYYIPVYELNEGKNKVIVKEETVKGDIKEREFIINKTPSEYDEMYKLKKVEKSDKLTLNTYQDEININIKDTDGILLTGSFYTNGDITMIRYQRFTHDINSNEWVAVSDSGNNNSLNKGKGVAKIINNYWAIDMLSLDSGGEKVELTAIDSLGDKVTKEIYINNTSKSNELFMKYSLSNKEIIDNFVSDEVVIMFNDNVKESRCERIVEEINGKIVGASSLMNYYVVQIDGRFASHDEANQYCKKLEKEYDEIKYVSPNYVVEMRDD